MRPTDIAKTLGIGRTSSLDQLIDQTNPRLARRAGGAAACYAGSPWVDDRTKG
jgi:hypothetical protein